MRITSKGQVTIPEDIRRAAGMLPGTDVDFVKDGKRIHVVKAKEKTRSGKTARDQRLGDVLDRLQGSATIKMSTEEIMALTRGVPSSSIRTYSST